MSKLQEQVREFHVAFNQPIEPAPVVPYDDRIRLRLRLIKEEFFELLASSLTRGGSDCGEEVEILSAEVETTINAWDVRVDLPEFADALADLDYVIEGTRLEFGIDGGPIADEVHRSNMAKLGGGKREDGKIAKPANWTPPDIRGELVQQGWTP